jgi:hypothetical protein
MERTEPLAPADVPESGVIESEIVGRYGVDGHRWETAIRSDSRGDLWPLVEVRTYENHFNALVWLQAWGARGSASMSVCFDPRDLDETIRCLQSARAAFIAKVDADLRTGYLSEERARDLYPTEWVELAKRSRYNDEDDRP